MPTNKVASQASTSDAQFPLVNGARTIALAQELVRIPSPLWGESQVARYLYAYLKGIGLEVEIQAVPTPGGGRSHQIVARRGGTRPGPCTLLCGHLDTSGWGAEMFRPEQWTRDPYGGDLKEGWLYGLGSLNMKGGLAAMISAVEAHADQEVDFGGDIVLAGVMGETGGGVGVQHLLSRDARFDQAIVTEPTNLNVSTISVGYVQGWLQIWGELRHFEPYLNPINAMAPIIEAFGPSYRPLQPEGWLTFEPSPQLPGYPRMAIRQIESGQDDCRLFFDIRTVPGQNDDSVRQDLEQLLQEFESELAGFETQIIIPASPYTPNFPAAPSTPTDHPLTQALVRHHPRILGEPARVGAGDRLGLASDASHLKAAGIATIEYGPGRHPVWPMVDERIWAADIVHAAQVIVAVLTDLHR